MHKYIIAISLFFLATCLSTFPAHAAITDINLNNTSIDENTPSGTTVGTLSTTGGTAPYTYTLTNGTGSEDNAHFTIDGDQLKLTFTPDYENPQDVGNTAGNNSYAIRVQVTDAGQTVLEESGSDYSSAHNYYGGFYNTQNFPNNSAFAALKADGSIVSWGDSTRGGSGAPTGAGYTHIYSNGYAFAALKADGSIAAWGNATNGGSGAPTGTGYTRIYSNSSAFAALKADGSIAAWGNATNGGSGAPTGTGYTRIYSTYSAFAALKSDGSIVVWGDSARGGTGAPADAGYTQIYSNNYAFAALKSDGSIIAWGDSTHGGSGAPNDTIYTYVSSISGGFAALKQDSSISVWGSNTFGAPVDSGYIHIYSNGNAFAALKSDGSISAWANSSYGGSGAPTDTGYMHIYSTYGAFAALKSDGSITAWGNSSYGGSGAPTGTVFAQVYTNNYAFAALKSDGSITAWGNSSYGGSGAPIGTGYSMPYGTMTTSNDLYEKPFIITTNDVSEDIIISDPDITKISNAVTDGYFTLNSGTINNATQVITAVNVTVQDTIFSALFPSNTTITETTNQPFNFQNLVAQNVTNTVQQEQPTSRAAVRIGIPGEKLNFSQNITLTVSIGEAFNGQTLDILYQQEGESTWNTHGTCTVTNGQCTFTTNHATIYTINGEHKTTGDTPMNLNVQVQETLSMDCFDPSDSNTTVSLGTITNPGMITAGTPAVGQSRCTVTTNADQGYYLTLTNSDPINATLTHTDPHTGTIYEISDVSAWNEITKTTSNWTVPTTKGLGFSVITFPETNTTHNQFDGVWNETNQCPEGSTADTNDYAGIPTTPQTITAVTAYQETATTTDICYKVDVLPSQPSGQYTGSVTFTATSDASGYWQ